MATKTGCLQRVLWFCFGVLLLGAFAYFASKQYILQDNIKGDKPVELFIPSGATFQDFIAIIQEKEILQNKKSFFLVANARGFSEVKPGRYILESNWNNLQIVNCLRSGAQKAVKVVINNVRTKEQLAGKISSQLELDSLTLLRALNDEELANEYGFTLESFPAMFLANTYQMYWNSSIETIVSRMNKEYNRYWTEERKEKASQLGLSPHEVIILASIVEEETKNKQELSTVAGLYLNRINRGMKLEADPTVKYAVGNFALRRVLNIHTAHESPYNTYLNVGLPPGPIRIPELNVIEASLQPKTHDYIFMCASPKLDGTHLFAKTLAQHNANAQKYRQELNRMRIYR